MRSTLLLLALAVPLAVGCAQQPAGEVADTIYKNGKIYTVNEAQPWAESLAVVALGDRGEIRMLLLEAPLETAQQFGDRGAVESSNPFDDSAKPILVAGAEKPRNVAPRVWIELLGNTFDLYS